MTDDLRHLPLEALHRAAGAKFGPFCGWSMPLTYPPGVFKEHLRTRETAGLFDISHMKLIAVEGPAAAAFLSLACPLDAAGMAVRQSKYSFLLDEQAGILDDLIVTRLGEDRFMVVANAGNAEADAARLADLGSAFDVTVSPLDRVFLAIQGPAAADIVAKAGVDAAGLVFMQGFEPRPGWFMSRSGYTGEDGFEIGLPASEASEVAQLLLADERLAWVGLAARDSLRLEAGLCLHGSDITSATDPASAALLWAIPKPVRETGGFVGAAALRSIIANGPTERRVGLKPEGRQPVRGGTQLFDAEGLLVGRVTSGGFGPSVGHPVAMGFVAASLARPGTWLTAEVRGARLPIEVHSLPFTPHRYHKG